MLGYINIYFYKFITQFTEKALTVYTKQHTILMQLINALNNADLIPYIMGRKEGKL